MKRCIICGNLGDDSSIYCPACGNRFPDDSVMDAVGEETGNTTDAAAQEVQTEAAQQNDSVQELKAVEAGQDPKEPDAADGEKSVKRSQAEEQDRASKESAPRRQGAQPSTSDQAHRPRHGRGGPQIYGQSGLPADGGTTYAQGAIRRDISGGSAQNLSASRTVGIQRSTVAAQGQQAGVPGNGRPVRQHTAGNGHPANGQAQAAGRRGAEANSAVRQANGRTNRPMQGGIQEQQGGRQMRPTQGNMQGRPNGRGDRAPMQGPQPGRPVQGYRPQGFAGVKIRETARGALTSPIFLLLVLLHTVFLGGSVAAIFMGQLNYSQVARLLTGFELPAQLGSYMNSALTLLTKLDSSAVVINLIFCIPDLLFCVGLWLVYGMARTKDEEMAGAGFTFMKIVVILNMIRSCLAMLFLLVLVVALVISAWVSGMTDMLIASVVVLVLIIVVTMAVIMYYFCYLATIRTCRVNAVTGGRYGRVSPYVAVIHIIGSLLSVVGILSGIVNMEIAGIVKSVGMLGWMLLFGAWIFMYKSRMEGL